MKKLITTLILLAGIVLNVFAQQEIPMFFDSELGFLTSNNYSRIAYSQDGSKIATVFNSCKIIIWNVATGREITRTDGHGNRSISNMIFSPNGRQLVSCSDSDSNIKIWDTTNGALIRDIGQRGVMGISFSPDGNRIIGRYFDSGLGIGNGLKAWNALNGSEIWSITGRIFSATFSPDGRQILVNFDETSIRILDATNGQTLKTINSNGKYFSEAVFSPNGRFIASTDWDKETDVETIRIFNTETGQEIISFPVSNINHLHNLSNLFYSLDGRQLLINVGRGIAENGIKIFNPETGQELRNINNVSYCVGYSSDGRSIVTNLLRVSLEKNFYGSSCALLLDAATGRKVGVIGYGPLNIGAKAFADLQIARFLNDAAAVSRNEAILKFITDRRNVTCAEVETFYKDNIGRFVSDIVDENIAKSRFGTPVADDLVNIKNVITQFMLNPTQESFRVLYQSFRRYFALSVNNDRNGAAMDVFIYSVYSFNLALGARLLS